MSKNGKYMHIIDLEKKPLFAMVKIVMTKFYINFFANFISILALLFCLYGSIQILSGNGQKAIILTNFGGFLGGMFTFIAVVISLKEFLINKRKNGSHKFSELINEMFNVILPELNKSSFTLGSFIKHPPHLSTPTEKSKIRQEIELIKINLTKIKFQILSKYGEIFFLNKDLGIIIFDEMKNIENELNEIINSTYSITRYVTSKNNSSNLDDDNLFIKSCLSSDGYIVFTESQFKIVKSMKKLMKMNLI